MHVWILADVPRSVPGGMRRHMELHALGLERLGHRASVLLREDIESSPLPRELRVPGARSLAALMRRYRAERPDIVNVHTQCAPAWIFARRAGLIDARVVVMSYAADEPEIRISKPKDTLRWARIAVPARLSFPRADGIWCVNRQDAAYYTNVYAVDGARVVVLPHAVADSFYRHSEPVERNQRRLLFVGSFIPRKGVDVLTAALGEVIQSLPDVEIILAGTQWGEERVREALGPKLAARSQILDRVDDATLSRLYHSSGLLLLPSRREGLPISMLEAMASGCPTLAAANSGMLDVIVPGKNGWLEPSFEPSRWAQRITELLADPAALSAASRGAAEVAHDFRVEDVARRVALWYEKLLA